MLNSAGQFENSAAYRGLPFASIIVLNYAGHMEEPIVFSFKIAICHVALCRLCRIAIAISRTHSITQFSLIFFVIIVSV